MAATKKKIKILPIILIIVVIVLLYYFYKKNKSKNQQQTQEFTPANSAIVQTASTDTPNNAPAPTTTTTNWKYNWLKRGTSRKENVKSLQRLINKNRDLYGMKHLAVDGIFGNETEKAVVALTGQKGTSYYKVEKIYAYNYKKKYGKYPTGYSSSSSGSSSSVSSADIVNAAVSTNPLLTPLTPITSLLSWMY